MDLRDQGADLPGRLTGYESSLVIRWTVTSRKRVCVDPVIRAAESPINPALAAGGFELTK